MSDGRPRARTDLVALASLLHECRLRTRRRAERERHLRAPVRPGARIGPARTRPGVEMEERRAPEVEHAERALGHAGQLTQRLQDVIDVAQVLAPRVCHGSRVSASTAARSSRARSPSPRYVEPCMRAIGRGLNAARRRIVPSVWAVYGMSFAIGPAWFRMIASRAGPTTSPSVSGSASPGRKNRSDR